MLSPVEVRNHEFRHSIRGYNDTEVDAFFERVSEDYERLYKENADLKEALQRMNTENAKYRKIEETLSQTLVLAQQNADQLRANAVKEAELLMESAHNKLKDVFKAYEEMLMRLNVYRAEIKGFLASQVDLVESQDKRIDELINFITGQDVKTMVAAIGQVPTEEVEQVE
ncbi:MAG: DivIVA domain-containing protein [Chitinophagales bacterium]